MLAKTTLREALNALNNMQQGNAILKCQCLPFFWACFSLLSFRPVMYFFGHSFCSVKCIFMLQSHPSASPNGSLAWEPPTWLPWGLYRTRSPCVPPMTRTRWPENAWPRPWRIHVNAGPKSSSLGASTEVGPSFIYFTDCLISYTHKPHTKTTHNLHIFLGTHK